MNKQHARVDSVVDVDFGRRESTDSDDLEAFFANYVPLSSLPTPPESEAFTKNECWNYIINATTENAKHTDPAQHLANLVPYNVFPQRPSAVIVQGFLSRTNLSFEVLGLSACILDALSAHFARHWRQEIFLCQKPYTDVEGTSMTGQKPHTTLRRRLQPTSSEVIVLSALSLAVAYLDDQRYATIYWAEYVSNALFASEEINVTSRCIMRDIDYRLHVLAAPEFVEEAMLEMRPAQEVYGAVTRVATSVRLSQSTKGKPVVLQLTGVAKETNGILTPGPSSPRSMSSFHSHLSLT